jgi:hypothetical protein
MVSTQVDMEKRRLICATTSREEGAVLLKLPSRRWMPARRVFIVPMVKLNMVMLKEAIAAKRIQFEESVVATIRQLAVDKKGDRQFPKWYVHKLQPFQVQREALAKSYKNDEFALFMKMGRGKSKAFIDLMTAHFYEKRIQLVVAVMPLSVTTVWGGEQGELAKHSSIPTDVIYADSKFDASKIKLKQDRLLWIMVGIESLSQGRAPERIMPVFDNYKVGMLIDEASRIANHKTIRTEVVVEMGRKAVIRGIGTGTPAKKRLTDLYSLFNFLSPNIIGCGDFYPFRNRYCIMGGYKRKEIVGYDNVDELMRLIEPYTYTCGKDETLPKQIFMHREVDLTDEQREIYRKIRKAEIEGLTIKNALSKVLRLQQVVGGFYSLDPKKKVNPITGKVRSEKGDEVHFLPAHKNPKILDLHQMLDEHDGSPVIIWARFLKEIDDLQKAMSDHGKVVRVTGGLTGDERIRIRDDFQEGKYDFLVGNAQSGGLGLTLTRSHTTVYYSNTQSGEDRLQSEDRTHRHGQEEPCLYIDMIARKTVDVPIFASMLEKKDLDVYVREKIRAAGGQPTDAAVMEYLEQLMGEV